MMVAIPVMSNGLAAQHRVTILCEARLTAKDWQGGGLPTIRGTSKTWRGFHVDHIVVTEHLTATYESDRVGSCVQSVEVPRAADVLLASLGAGDPECMPVFDLSMATPCHVFQPDSPALGCAGTLIPSACEVFAVVALERSALHAIRIPAGFVVEDIQELLVRVRVVVAGRISEERAAT